MWQNLSWTFLCSRVSESSNLQNLNINLSRLREIAARKCGNYRDVNKSRRDCDSILLAANMNCNPINASISSIVNG